MTGPARPAPPETLDDDPPVRTAMSRRVVAIDAAAPLRTALRLMTAGDVRHLPVIRGDRCVGMVAEVDLLRGLAAVRGPLGTARLTVDDVLRPVPVVSPETSLRSAAALMDAERVDALLIGTPDALTGIVTATDLVHAIAARPR
ncbi:CBS domain-containing protein [Pseudonocardia sp. RS010]|uniref:CBS domain-containing protein n=1 Tax=Pseudonocardia sp. RS010 TaxID=3385979 RepID=UPI0039A1CCB0